MNFVRFAITRPVAVMVILILILLFGAISLFRLPIQLIPEVNRPEISIMTNWAGATPYEIESEIVEPQEKVLKNLENLEEYESTSSTGRGRITLRFELGTNLQKALLDASNKLNEVRNYPDNVDKPVIRATGETTPPAVWMMVQTLDGVDADISTYMTFLEDYVTEKFERIEGVSELFIRGGRNDELHITIDTLKLAHYGLVIDDLIEQIAKRNINTSAGTLDLGNKTYRVRTAAKFTTPQEVEELIIYSSTSGEILLKDVASIELTHAKKESVGIFRGKAGISIGVRPEVGANVIKMTDTIEQTAKELNRTLLADQGLQIVWNYDQRPYILGAISLVKQNIAFGGVLAVMVLFLFLRSITPTLVVSITIPLSVIGTFIFLEMMGRSLNTISLAGVSFAVGMLVDSAIVVLENIDRHHKMGKNLFDSALDGTSEIWGALVISALTTIAVFVPIIFLADEAGQLFKDIAIAVTAAISLSLFVSVLAIPMLWRLMMERTKTKAINAPKIEQFGKKIKELFMHLVELSLKNHKTRATAVLSLLSLSLISSYLMMPKMDYLPHGNRNQIQNIFITPPGLSFEETSKIGYDLFEKLAPYMDADHGGYPAIGRAYFIGAGSFMFLGVAAKDEEKAPELISLLKEKTSNYAGIRAITKQAGVFERGLGKSNAINIDISGDKIDDITNYAREMMAKIPTVIAAAQIRPVPLLDLNYPEITIYPDESALRLVGMDARELGLAADVVLDGRKVSEYQGGGIKKIDMILKSSYEEIKTPEDLRSALVATPKGAILPLGSLAKIVEELGMAEIRHLGGQRTITLEVTPPKEITIQEAMERIEKEVITKDDNLFISLSGTADKLLQTVLALKWNFVLAVTITYLLMAALFGSFVYPFIILFSVPLAIAGGFVGLELTNRFIAMQHLDILTMLGFIILVGIVVNSAILIVHQALNFIRYENYEPKEAIIASVESRIRPIYMSALTSVFGMLPLILVPGPGSEMYRGLGSVITGGLLFSTIFVIFVVPALLYYLIEKKPKATSSL